VREDVWFEYGLIVSLSFSKASCDWHDLNENALGMIVFVEQVENRWSIEANNFHSLVTFNIMVANAGQRSRRFARSLTRAAEGARQNAAVLSPNYLVV
jgi:hypothetical protein